MLSLLPPGVTILHVLASRRLCEVQQYTLSLVSCSSSSLGCQSHGHQCYLMTLGWERERDSTSILPLSEFFSFLQPILDLYMARIGGSAWEPLIIRSSFVILVCGLLLCTEPSGECLFSSFSPSLLEDGAPDITFEWVLFSFGSNMSFSFPDAPDLSRILYSNDTCCLSSALHHALIAPCQMGNSLSVCRSGLYWGEE